MFITFHNTQKPTCIFMSIDHTTDMSGLLPKKKTKLGVAFNSTDKAADISDQVVLAPDLAKDIHEDCCSSDEDFFPSDADFFPAFVKPKHTNNAEHNSNGLALSFREDFNKMAGTQGLTIGQAKRKINENLDTLRKTFKCKVEKDSIITGNS
jgi:hypothetical protein